MDQLDSLNYATDTLSRQAPAVVQRVLSQSPTLQVQDNQCNKSVQISTHQQIHHVVSKELLPPSAQMTVPQQTVINHSLTCTVMSSRNHKSPWQLLQSRNFPIWWTVEYLSSVRVHPSHWTHIFITTMS